VASDSSIGLIDLPHEMARVAATVEQALDIRKKILPPHHPDRAQSLINLGTLLRQQGHLDESVVAAVRAVPGAAYPFSRAA